MEDQGLWTIIKNSCERLSFENYALFINAVICPEVLTPAGWRTFEEHGFQSESHQTIHTPLLGRRRPQFADVETHRVLKVATEAFLMVNCGVEPSPGEFARLKLDDRPGEQPELRGSTRLDELWRGYVKQINGIGSFTLPYLELVHRNLDGLGIGPADSYDEPSEQCNVAPLIRGRKLTRPCFLELIWSYWNEEGMLVQSMDAISKRFQSRSGTQDDPLRELDIDPLRPLGNLLWGYIQDEPHRLTLSRRSYEYDHQYGVTRLGKAAPAAGGAESRSRVLEAFHSLLTTCAVFYRQDDDTTVLADALPVLNSLREGHLLLAEGAHNQYGDLPWTSRQEMLMQQWLLARPEIAEFLPTPVMVAYPEPWMGQVDSMKRLQGWGESSVRHFRDLAVFGEQILLSIRFTNWADETDCDSAANWVRFWREQVQRYIHAYRAVSGADLARRPSNRAPGQ